MAVQIDLKNRFPSNTFSATNHSDFHTLQMHRKINLSNSLNNNTANGFLLQNQQMNTLNSDFIYNQNHFYNDRDGIMNFIIPMN